MQTFLILWFSLTAISVAFVSYDLIFRTPEMKVMKWGWIMVTLYTGIFGLIVYILSCRESSPGTHEKFVAPLWKQTVGSTIHCMAGDATGVIVVAFLTALLNLPMGVDSILEYIVGLRFWLIHFSVSFMKEMLGGSYKEAVLKTWYPEWVSMNFVMAGMVPIMIILMTNDMRNMEPTSMRFWGIMSLASIVGGTMAIPVNWWMVKTKMKHGMGTEKVLGKGGAKVSTSMKMEEMPASPSGREMKDMGEQSGNTMQMHMAADNKTEMNMESNVSLKTKIFVAIISIIILAIAITIAGYWGDFSMKPRGEMNNMKM